MGREPRLLACGCERRDLEEREEARTDDQVHAEWEKVHVDIVTGRNTPSAARSAIPDVMARSLTWFFDHDDARGVEAVRALDHAERTKLVRALRRVGPDEYHKPEALRALFSALGLAS